MRRVVLASTIKDSFIRNHFKQLGFEGLVDDLCLPNNFWGILIGETPELTKTWKIILKHKMTSKIGNKIWADCVDTFKRRADKKNSIKRNIRLRKEV